MKTLLITLVVMWAALGLAKDPEKSPHVYVVYAILNRPTVDKDGHTWYAMLCQDDKGGKVVVGVSKETIDQLKELSETTTGISYEQGN